MTAERGGRAEKLGNRYERWCVARQLLLLLRGDVVSVTLEGLGDDECGVDLWVVELDGVRKAIQCKRGNGANGKWTIADLKRRNVIESAKKQLQRDQRFLFVLSSRDPAPLLDGLAERARSSGGDPESFWAHQVQTASDYREAFQQYCRAVGLRFDVAADRVRAHDFLQRTYVDVQRDDAAGLRDLGMIASLLVDGERNTVVSALAELAESNLGAALHQDDVVNHLISRMLPPRKLSNDPRLSDQIALLNRQFADSIHPHLIRGSLIERNVSRTIVTTVCEADQKLVLVHGRAGFGKSAALFEVADELRSSDHAILTLRLDRRVPSVSARRYGREVCDLPESPVACLKALAGDRPSVLILDQLDAIRWTSAHAAGHWETTVELIESALLTPGMRVIVACRTFDLRSDPQIAGWRLGASALEIEVGPLTESEVIAVVDASGADYARMSASQRRLLANPLCLSLWTTLGAGPHGAPAFSTMTDLMGKFWDNRRIAMDKLHVPNSETKSALRALVIAMDKSGRPSAPAYVLDEYPAARTALESLHVTTTANNRISFGHQAYLDYLLALQVVQEAVNGKPIAEWLKGSGQSLFRRQQLRLVMDLLRDNDPSQYAEVVAQLLRGADVRFHIKHLLLQALADRESPSTAEIALVLDLLSEAIHCGHIARHVLYGRPHWVEIVDDQGVIAAWLGENDERDIARAIELLGSVSAERGDALARHLRDLMVRGVLTPELTRVAFTIEPDRDSDSLFELRLELIRTGLSVERLLLCDWHGLATRNPLRAIRLFEAMLRWIADELARSGPEKATKIPRRWIRNHADLLGRELSRAASALPAEALDRLTPVVALLEAREWPCKQYSEERPTFELSTAIIDAQVAALQKLASTDVEAFRLRIESMTRSARIAQAVLFRALAVGPLEIADLALTWICERDDPFSHRELSQPTWRWAREIVERFSRHCSPSVYARLEAAILDYRDRGELESARNRADHTLAVGPNRIGRFQHALITALPQERLGNIARGQLGQLDRKFGPFQLPKAFTSGVWTGAAPIRNRAHRLSDRAWLRLMAEDLPKKDRRSHYTAHIHRDSTHHEFARELREQTKCAPARFARLAMLIPESAPSEYLAGVLEALVAPDADPNPLLAAALPEVESLLEKTGYVSDSEVAKAYCRLVGSFPNHPWPDAILDSVCRYAIDHGDPTSGDYFYCTKSDSAGAMRPDALASSLNTVRSLGVRAIQSLVHAQPRLLPRFAPSIERVVLDRHPVVGIAAMGVCLSVLNCDAERAMPLLVRACEHADDIALETMDLGHFIACARFDHLETLRPILRRMCKSTVDGVAELGAGWVVGIALDQGRMDDERESCLAGTVAQRRGAAKTAVGWFPHDDVTDGCVRLLKRLFHDPSGEVRQVAARFLYEWKGLTPAEVECLADYVDSPAFDDQPEMLFEVLQKHTGALLPLINPILTACHKLADKAASVGAEAAPRFGWQFKIIPPILLRAYEQAEEQRQGAARDACLDAWDALLEAGAKVALDQLQTIS